MLPKKCFSLMRCAPCGTQSGCSDSKENESPPRRPFIFLSISVSLFPTARCPDSFLHHFRRILRPSPGRSIPLNDVGRRPANARPLAIPPSPRKGQKGYRIARQVSPCGKPQGTAPAPPSLNLPEAPPLGSPAGRFTPAPQTPKNDPHLIKLTANEVSL